MPQTILLVEHPEVQKFLRFVLQERCGYTILEAQLQEASGILCDSTVQLDLLITNKPQSLIGLRPGLNILYTSSTPDERFIRLAQGRNFAVLMKPFRYEQLLEKVRWLLSGSGSMDAQVRGAARSRFGCG